MKLEIYDHHELNFVELNITGTNSQYIKCDPESKYLDGCIFKLFAESFEKANNLYEYYGATKYNPRFIVPLRNRLLTNLTVLDRMKSSTEFQDHINAKVEGKEFLLALIRQDKNWLDRWKVYLEKLIKINKELIDLVDFCIDEDRILWVIGY